MIIQKIKDSSDYLKVDNAYIINTNTKEYKQALERRRKQQSFNEMKSRLDMLEEKIDVIFNILTKKT